MIGRPATIYIARPELIEDVLATHSENFDKGGYFKDSTDDLLGNGIFSVDDLKWAQQRKTTNNLFLQRALRDSMAVTVNEQVQVIVEILQRKANDRVPDEMFNLFNRFTFEVSTEIGFGVKIGDLKDEAVTPVQAAFNAAQPLLIWHFLEPSWVSKTKRYINVDTERKLKSCIQLIDDTVYGIISQSMENRLKPESSTTDGRKDIISLFLDEVSYDIKSEPGSKTAGNASLDPKFLSDVVVNFLMARRDTTAQTLSWFLYCLSQNPTTGQRVREELASRLLEVGGAAGREEAFAPSMAQLHQLVYLEAAIKETLRLYLSVPDNGKTALRNTVLCDGTFVKVGMNVGYPGYVLGRMTRIWGPDAKKFRPERWIDSETSNLTSVSTSKFNAFHAGPRMCLAVLLSKFRFELVPGQEITYDLGITLPIKGALMMNVTPNVPSSN